ncbi:glycosyltransferase [Cronobacter dublinensis]|uniref:glycosyltransferase n=1 Tax=Cronobacter dublinensis TaxID=413497 RepID=UPI002738A2BF|nr:glycosyltransferase [Cronobacter dublinensis]ELQ6127162.1 glycosyltransferase [Cronobacter dublinensis]ELQ6131893.1 glycosyltransferase [Cronobacter dublinensis]ELQ6170737.1 glycosyltransferase [Cronobacter dublinensis]ELY4003671.1 glycosyltransferase [Cronobacter dublinensis]ELY4512871.1 glycosyltransferase [Cronobacter dublinensis]
MINLSSPVADFSVLMSVYSKENPEFLNESLSSVYSSSLQPAEVVLVEDGPLTESLDKIVNYYKAKHGLVTVKLAQNSGLGVALNKGIEVCTHEIIARMDTDDICDHKRFEKQWSFMLSHPDTALLGGAIAEYNNDYSMQTGLRKVPTNNVDIVKMAVSRNPFNHMTVMFKKSAVKACGGYQHHLYMEDYNLWLRFIAGGYEVANLPDVLVMVRAGNEMISRRRGGAYIKSEYNLMKLKNKLGIGSKIITFSIFCLRALSRYMPTSILQGIYYAFRSRN